LNGKDKNNGAVGMSPAILLWAVWGVIVFLLYFRQFIR